MVMAWSADDEMEFESQIENALRDNVAAAEGLLERYLDKRTRIPKDSKARPMSIEDWSLVCTALVILVKEEYPSHRSLAYIAETWGGSEITSEMVDALTRLEERSLWWKSPPRA